MPTISPSNSSSFSKSSSSTFAPSLPDENMSENMSENTDNLQEIEPVSPIHNILAEYPKFEDIPVSTKTFIVTTNLKIIIKKIFLHLPITPYIVVQKKRGRKKRAFSTDPNKDLKDGSIIGLELGNERRGVMLKNKKKKNTKSINFFRNSMTVVMLTGGKFINFKISENGKFQMTGCKFDFHAENCVKYIWEYIKDKEDLFVLLEKPYLKALFVPAMRNIDFNLNFVVDREKVDEYINNETQYYSLLETSIGYTGVNIKFPVTYDINTLKLKELFYRNGKWSTPHFVHYSIYLDQLKPKERAKKLAKQKFNTFLLFNSGKCILSSMCEEFSKDDYYEFLSIIRNNREKFRECLLA